MTAPHDVPTAAQLVEAVREFLERDVMEATTGRVQFHTRIAVNVLGMVERELALGASQEDAYRAGMAALGMADDAELAAAIRSGAVAPEDVTAFVKATVEDKLRVANPKYIEG